MAEVTQADRMAKAIDSLRYVLNFADSNSRVSTVMQTFTMPDRETTKERLEWLWQHLSEEPARHRTEAVKPLAAALGTYDSSVKACPANKTFLGDKPCPKCRAGRDEGCREEIRAAMVVIEAARDTLKGVQS